MNDAMRLVDQDARRGDLFDGATVRGRVGQRGRGAGAACKLRHLLAHAHRTKQPWQRTRLVAGVRGRLIEPRRTIDRAEQAGWIFRRLGRAEQQEAAGVQRIVESAAHLLLQFTVEIDEHVAAGNQVDAREWRILEEIVQREQHHVAQILAHAVAVALADEEAAQALLAHIVLDRRRIAALASDGQRACIEIGAEYLDRRTQIAPAALLHEQHGERIGLLAGRTSRHPHTYRIGRLVFEQFR